MRGCELRPSAPLFNHRTHEITLTRSENIKVGELRFTVIIIYHQICSEHAVLLVILGFSCRALLKTWIDNYGPSLEVL